MVVIPSPRGGRGVCFKNANLSWGCNAAWYQAVGLGASCWASGTYTALLCHWLACLHPGLTAVRGRLRRPASSAPSPGRAAALCSSATWTRSHPPKTFPVTSSTLLIHLRQCASSIPPSFLVTSCMGSSDDVRAPSSVVLLWCLQLQQLQQLQQRKAFAAFFVPLFFISLPTCASHTLQTNTSGVRLSQHFDPLRF